MRNRHGRSLPNRIKASLSAFQREKVKVLGFGVKARPRPQRMALRWVHAQFALVGANGKACGEASRVSVSEPPPFLGGCLPLILMIVIVDGYEKSAPCGALCVWCRLLPGCGCCGRCDVRYGVVRVRHGLSHATGGRCFAWGACCRGLWVRWCRDCLDARVVRDDARDGVGVVRDGHGVAVIVGECLTPGARGFRHCFGDGVGDFLGGCVDVRLSSVSCG